ncbi:hypothetical protein [Microseira wollei]|uniref:O-antigen polymerase n=1 Tax=Microseira wollei NIES-4236 TaxID=2530354 RepID=A0AAV3XHQ1_9CYAN|nr:hypothetical protein [Microseira wollei]GET40271.1 hypothetical protein MiSe_50800 [Microseira wollei NIES-4236]
MSGKTARTISIFLHSLLFLAIASAVLTYWYVSEYALKGNWHPEYYTRVSYILLVPTWQKVLKDGFTLLLLLFSALLPPTNTGKSFSSNRGLKASYALCLCVLGIAIARSITSELSLVAIISCLRPIFVVFALFFFCHRHLNRCSLRWVFEWVNVLAVIQVFYAIRQRLFAVLYNGVSWIDNGTVRSVGTFIGPNTMGLFLALVFYLNLEILPRHRWRYILLLFCVIGVFFSGSRSATLIVVLLTCFSLFNQIKRGFKSNKERSLMTALGAISLPAILILLILQVNSLNTRAAGTSASSGRLEIIFNYIDRSDTFSLLFGKHLGFGSEILFTLHKNGILKADSGSLFLADSTWASLLAQFGFLGIFAIFITIYYLWKTPEYITLPYKPAIKNNLIAQRSGLLVFIAIISSVAVLQESYAILPMVLALLFALRLELPLYQTYYTIEKNDAYANIEGGEN